jgi:DNA polymerase-1
MPKLVLLDGHSLAFRAFFGLPPEMTTSRGEMTNAVYGFASMLLSVLKEEQPEYIAVAFDTGPTFRHKEFSEYKSTRARMPDELRAQIPRIRELVNAFNIPIYEITDFEADDLLGTLARQSAEQQVNAVLCSGDRDLFQLVGPRIVVRYTSGGPHPKTIIYDEATLRARYGLAPAQLVDHKALIGDKSDNIPGVPGIGEKTATQLLQQFGSVEGLYEHLAEVKPARIQEILAQHRDQVFRNKHLATIVTHVPSISLDLDACRTTDYDRDHVVSLFRDLEFRSLLERLPESERVGPPQQMGLFDEESPSSAGKTAKKEATNYRLVDTVAALDEVIQAARGAALLAVDVETTSTDPIGGQLVGIALAWDEGQAAYIPVAHREQIGSPVRQVPWEITRERLKPILEDAAIPKCAHNGEFDLTVLAEAGIETRGLAFDTMLAEWLCDPASRNLGLKALAFARLGVEMTNIEAIIGKGKAQRTMAEVSPAEVAAYACADVDMTLRLVPILRQDLEAKKQTRLFTEVEMPLVPVLVAIERAGVLLDLPYLKAMEKMLAERLVALEQEIHELAGFPFNINSTQQLADVLFGKLALSTQGLPRTATGKVSTAADVLESMRGKHPIIDYILEHRQISKLQSTYVQALPALVNPRTGRVHTSFNQTGSETGRISSSNPNLQNIPIRTELGRRVRKAFIAPPGWRLISADYSQVELRILAHVSKDPALLGAFARGEDVHASTAARIYNVPIDQVTPEMRRVAKTTNFGLMYGQGAFGLSQQTGMSQSEASDFIAKYFAAYPQVKAWLDNTRSIAARQGYVETLLGRRRYFPELQSEARTNYNVRQAAERAAINAPIQGTAADIIKIAMIRLHAALQERRLRSRMILQVHDELVLEAPEDEVATAARLTKEMMEGAFTLDAPLKADVSVGQNWDEMESLP